MVSSGKEVKMTRMEANMLTSMIVSLIEVVVDEREGLNLLSSLRDEKEQFASNIYTMFLKKGGKDA